MTNAKQAFKSASREVRIHRAAAEAMLKKHSGSYDGEGDISTEQAYLSVGTPDSRMLPSAIWIAHAQRGDDLLRPLATRLAEDVYYYN